MSVCSDALYQHLLADLGPRLSSFEEKLDGFWPGMTYSQACAKSLQTSLLKKFSKVVNEDADARALEKFSFINLRCAEHKVVLTSSLDELLYGELKNSLYQFFYPQGDPLILSYDQILDHAKTGPGTSLGVRGTDFYTKLFSSCWTTTSPDLYRVYRNYIDVDPKWRSAEETRLKSYGSYRIVEGNRLHFVPKTSDISRVICIEPSLNMFFQQGLKHILEGRLNQSFGIDLAKQPDKNRELARIGSKEDSFATIDLSSASDSLSLSMLEDVLPNQVYAWFKQLRSPCTEVEGKQVALNMISTMGNAYTFPLETILFACVVSSAYKVEGETLQKPRGKSLGNFGVFGDDIICTRSTVRNVIRLLNILGFQVNEDKSFVMGPFRESCGSDYFCGRNVRPVFIKRLESQQDLYVAINALNLWTAKTGIPLSRTVGYLSSRCRFQPVPIWENEDAGIRVPFSMVENLRRDRNTKSIMYRRSKARPQRLFIRDGSIKARGRKLIYNPDGLLMTLLQGSIRNHTITVRHDRTLYETKWGIAPSWDTPLNTFGLSPNAWRQWKNAVYVNL